ncbi:MAG: diaminopimelate decarboxylase [PVC group bacterium]|nr:diaminopimelate decarboxylase [PVC group bacterium]
MHDFNFKKDQLFCENVSVEKIVKEVGTPVFVYSHKTLVDHLIKIKTAFAKISPLICYSMKANSNLTICSELVKNGAGIDIVSGGELYRAKKIGVSGKKIVYASVGKTETEIAEAIKTGILFFNAESIPELELINSVAGRLRKKQNVAIRINPNVDAHTHHYITTAKKQNKFGIDMGTSRKIFLQLSKKLKNVKLCGVHVHIGSQIEEVTPFIQAIKKSLALINELNKKGAGITHLNIGGGLGIVYRKERPQTADDYARAILPLLKDSGLKVILEPGRFIAGNAGILLAKITYVKDTPAKRFVIVDAAMNDLIRPSFYDAYHEIVPVKADKKEKLKKADVVGAICESGDFIAKDRRLPEALKPADILAVMSAGAYGFTMSSNYNSRRRAAEVLVKGNRYFIITKRESYADLIRNEVVAKV